MARHHRPPRMGIARRALAVLLLPQSLWARIAIVAGLFVICLVSQFAFYPRFQTDFLMIVNALPIVLAAIYWGTLPGLLSGAVSAIGIAVLVAIHKPSAFGFVAVAGGVFFAGFGALMGYFVELARRANRQAGELAESERKYRLLFEEVPVGLYRTTPDGRVLDANRALMATLGFEARESLLAMRAQDFWADAAQRSMLERQTASEGVAKDFEALLRRRSGEEFPALITLRAVRGGSGEVLHYEGSIKDISERQKIDTERRKVERLESVGQLAGGIAHDFNNILAGIRGFAEFIARVPGEDVRIRQSAERILSATERASRITDVLVLAIGNHMHSPRRVSLKELARSVVARAERLAPNVVYIADESSLECTWVLADPRGVADAVSELVANALHASPADRDVIVSAGTGPIDRSFALSQRHTTEGQWAWISVSDRGLGMGERILERIFEPYFTTQEFGKGAGLGLAKVYGIVRQHGGTIGVKSRPDEGTTVALYLPLDSERGAPGRSSP